jgi:glycosyltransferase involved in cell wall biosynthesis
MPPAMPSGAPWPRISIVTPTYNQGDFIEQTIRSVLLQGYPDLEYIIIDGGSTDQTLDIIKKYEPWLSHWVSEPDGGQSHAINKGLTRSTGKILNWLNSDDFLEDNALARIATGFSAAADDVGAIVGLGYFIDTERRILRSLFPAEVSKESLFQWLSGTDFLQPACFFTRTAWEQSGPVSEHLKYCMDLALWRKISERFQFALLPEPIAYAYRHPAAKTQERWLHARGEVALLFATMPDGFERASAMMNTLIDHMIARSNEPWQHSLRRHVALASPAWAKRAWRFIRGAR